MLGNYHELRIDQMLCFMYKNVTIRALEFLGY